MEKNQSDRLSAIVFTICFSQPFVLKRREMNDPDSDFSQAAGGNLVFQGKGARQEKEAPHLSCMSLMEKYLYMP